MPRFERIDASSTVSLLSNRAATCESNYLSLLLVFFWIDSFFFKPIGVSSRCAVIVVSARSSFESRSRLTHHHYTQCKNRLIVVDVDDLLTDDVRIPRLLNESSESSPG